MITKIKQETLVKLRHLQKNFFQLYLTFHSYGQYVLYPWGYAAVDSEDVNDLHAMGQAAAEAMRRTSGRAYSVGSAAKMLYPAAGNVDFLLSQNLLSLPHKTVT